jgi:hypothetical protein
MYRITEDELDTIMSFSLTTVYLGIFGIFFGAALSMEIALGSGGVEQSLRPVFALGIYVVGALAAVFFLLTIGGVLLDTRIRSRREKRIKDRSLSP